MNRRHRLRGRGRFVAVRRSTAGARSGAIGARALSNGLSFARVGFAVAKARSAVQRNRVRRRLRAAVSPLLGDLAGVDLVLTAPADVADLGFAELAQRVAAAARGALEGAGA